MVLKTHSPVRLQKHINYVSAMARLALDLKMKVAYLVIIGY